MLEETIKMGLSALGLPADASVLAGFRAYYTLLEETNRVMNLTAITGEDETARLHFLDSAAPLRLLPGDGPLRVIDVGTGAGFPGLPMKLLRPQLSLTLLDSQRKRVDFLRRVCETLSLDNVECVQGRAEDCGGRRERYDAALSRAVARLNILCELCLPYVRPGGMFLALKGPAAREELREAERAVSVLGGALEQVYEYPLPGEETRHNVVVIRKTGPTPKEYPRQYAQIRKAPL